MRNDELLGLCFMVALFWAFPIIAWIVAVTFGLYFLFCVVLFLIDGE